MSEDSKRALKQSLLDEYGHFSDKRIKNINKSNTFIVDDRTDRDVAADGSLYGWFCTMFLEVNTEDQVTLVFGPEAPVNDKVQAWFDERIAQHDNRGTHIVIDKGEQSALKNLLSFPENNSASNFSISATRL